MAVKPESILSIFYWSFYQISLSLLPLVVMFFLSYFKGYWISQEVKSPTFYRLPPAIPWFWFHICLHFSRHQYSIAWSVCCSLLLTPRCKSFIYEWCIDSCVERHWAHLLTLGLSPAHSRQITNVSFLVYSATLRLAWKRLLPTLTCPFIAPVLTLSFAQCNYNSATYVRICGKHRGMIQWEIICKLWPSYRQSGIRDGKFTQKQT